MSAEQASARPVRWPYWTLAIALIAFGAIGIFSIGLPFLALGLTLVAVAPLRRTAALFWPPIAAVIAFFAAWWLLGPVECISEVRATVVERGAEAPPPASENVTCESLVGISYDGEPFWLGPTAGVAAGALAYVALFLRLRPRPEEHTPARA